MKISREWLSDWVDLTSLSDEQIAARLTEIGHAVEGIESHGQDTIFEVEFTTNRVDAMSHRGLARELSAALDRPLVEIPPTTPPELTADAAGISITIDAPELASRYTGLVLRDLNIRPSSQKLRKRLESVGLRPINNVVDVTNYVMLDLGHPLHAFDLDRLKGPEIKVRAGRSNETIESLDGVLRKIEANTVVIADAERPVALGGVIGGANSEITDSTRNVLLECAHFTPSAIRKTARRLGISTDASYRFERGADPGDTVVAIQRAADLIVVEGGGKKATPIDVLGKELRRRSITLRHDRLHLASAGMIGPGYAMALFRRLGMEVTTAGDSLSVIVPVHRGDLFEEMDLVEEALRFFGFNAIPASLPRVTTGDVRGNPLVEEEEQIRDRLAAYGLTEVITYSFIRADENSRFSGEEPVPVTNALTENIASMRLTLLPGLLQTVAHNWSYGIKDGGVFEVGRTYHWTSDRKIRERHKAAFVLFGNVNSQWNEPKRAADYLDAKGIVEALAAGGRLHLDFAPAGGSGIKRGQASVARAQGMEIATLGLIEKAIRASYDIRADVVAGEIDLENLLSVRSRWKMSPVSRYPGVPMVLGLLHPPTLSYREIVERIEKLKVPYLHEIGIWDRYAPENREAEEVKTALGMWYQAFDRSLTQDEVAEIHRRLGSQIAELLPVKVITTERNAE